MNLFEKSKMAIENWRNGQPANDVVNCLELFLKNSNKDIKTLQKEVYDNARAHGWWDKERPIPETLCLIHSEVSEALEAYRKNDKENFKEELADIAIRLLDACGGYGIDLESEILKKHEKNKKRSYRHGNKIC